MLSGSLVRLVEDHAEQLTHGLILDLKQNPRTSAYHGLADSELHRRVYNVYHALDEFLGGEADALVEAHYSEVGKRRADEKIPLSQVIYMLIRTKAHLVEYVRRAGFFDSAVELYQFQEFRRLVDSFFDKAIYYTARAYEHEMALVRASQAVAGSSTGGATQYFKALVH